MIRDLKVLDVLASEVVDGEIRVNVGDSQTGKGVGSSVPVWATYGFVSRPAEPTPGGACMGLVFVDGDQQRVIGTRDNRAAAGWASLRAGESLMYGPTGQFIRCHEDGSVSMFTTDDGTKDGRSIYFKMSPDKGFEMACPWGRLRLGPTGFHVMHSSGARIDLGSIGGVVAPLDELASYAKMQAAMCSVMGSAVSLGTDGGAANTAAVAALVSLLTAMNTAMLTYISAAPGAPCTNVNTGAVTSALSTFSAIAANLGKTC